jgi:hypothetical protein
MRFLMAVLLLSTSVIGQNQGAANNDIVQKLLVYGNPVRVASLGSAEQAQAIRQLQTAQKHATGERSQEIAFLLAALGADYERNRDYLVAGLRGCNAPEIKNNCKAETGAFLIGLYARGHHDVLRPLLMEGSGTYNAAAAEMLGEFYADVLTANPTEFLETIRPLAAAKQKAICRMAGEADGGGMPAGQLSRAREQLRAIGGSSAAHDICIRHTGASAPA